jgi:hypothetical protein
MYSDSFNSTVEPYVILGCSDASLVERYPTFRDKVVVSSSKVEVSLKTRLSRRIETLRTNHLGGT